MNQMWQYWHKGVDDSTINEIIKVGNKYPIAHAGMGFDGSTQNQEKRSSEIRWINARDEKHIHDMLWYFAKEANKNAFGFDINYLNDIQFTTYYGSEGGKYDWHHDTFWANPTTQDRKISIVIQLSDPSEYEGGDFELDSQYEQFPIDKIKDKGTVMVFPSFLLHRVTPVTSGIRRSLVTWVEGPSFR